MKKLFKTCVWFCFCWRLTKGVMPLSGPWRSVWGPPSRPHVFTGLGSSAQSDLLYRAVLAPPKWVGQSPQSKTRNHSISGLRWTSGTPALLTFLVPTPPPPVAQPPLTADPRVSVSCLPGPQTARSSPPPGSSFSSQFSSQLEGCLFCDLPVCCPGTPTGSLGFSLWPLVAQSSHGSTLMKTANLKTAITIPSLTQCPGSPSFLQ